MSLVEIITQAAVDGVTLTLSTSGKLKVAGKENIINHWMPVLVEHKTELLSFLSETTIKPEAEGATPELYLHNKYKLGRDRTLNLVEIISRAEKDGVKFTLSDTGKVKVAGSQNTINTWMLVLREYKAELLSFLGKTVFKHAIEETSSSTESSHQPLKKVKIRISPNALKWLSDNLEALDKSGWTRAELYGRNKYKRGIAWLSLWGSTLQKVILRESGVIEFHRSAHGRDFIQTARPTRKPI